VLDGYNRGLTATTVDAQVMYYLGVTEWCKDTYNREDMVHKSRNDGLGGPGSLKNSHGWKRKMVDNEIMAQDVRNMGLVGTADSVPYFKDKKARGGVPLMVRNGNLSPQEQLELRNCHLVGMLPNEVFEIDPDTGLVIRVIKKNSTLFPLLLMLADELNDLYVHGCQAIDATKPVGHAERHFTLRVVLLYW
jgi:hypothetical protein